MRPTLLFLLALAFTKLSAQTNVRAWYADGQVWVIWETAPPFPETYAIYASPNPFSNTDDALLIGRLFPFEYLPLTLKEQVDTAATFRIPDGMGGTYQLAGNEALFVGTPHESDELYFAVAEWGETAVTPGVNITDEAVPIEYDPDGDPVECHLQATFPSPFAAGFTCHAYTLWADGRQNQWEGRPDFPIMANAAKNGMPSLFMVSVPVGLDFSEPVPLSVWLHGGEGTARQSLAGNRAVVNIKPEEGVLLAHDDKLIGWRGNGGPHLGGRSWHFGWRKNWDPFSSGNLPNGTDTIVNYTQRRYLWIDGWLARNFNIDTNRIHINGHSMGSAGTTALAKCYPRHYASASVMSNGFGGPVTESSEAIFGATADNFPTNLINRDGGHVGFAEVWNLIDNCSPERDWPLIRCWHGKNDNNNAMGWDEEVVENFRAADSLGMGVQVFWSERGHNLNSGSGSGDHWLNGNQPDQQTILDNVAYEESHFRADESFPAFFNHRLQPGADDPGDGTPGTGASGVGDDWGTWGGYHRWEDVETDETFYGPQWKATVWLEGNAVFGNDNCPVEQLTSDIVLRRFPPFVCPACATGNEVVRFTVTDLATGETLSDEEVAFIEEDSLLLLPDVTIYREDIRKVRIETHILVPTTSVGASPFTAELLPNPVADAAALSVVLEQPGRLTINLSNINGQIRTQYFAGKSGDNLVPLDVEDLAAGIYFVQIINEQGGRAVLKLVKR
ncbi:MAG TPA: T9SS type A sorting domain-containing protein [Bacteroidetes bacterium]|nr:T9SS type A sorting domain-containing protein [Bacteroidota bacterium]